MNRFSWLFPILLVLVRSSAWANPPDYLNNDQEPAVRALDLASPFTEYVPEQEQVGLLGILSSEPFFKYAEFSLQPRLYYRYVQNNSGVSQAFAAGGSLGLETGWWRGTLQLGASVYTTQPIAAPGNADRTGLLSPGGDEISVLGQAWARLKLGPAIATLFRQDLELPFINGNDSRMIPNTFEAYQLDAEPSENLRINFGYVAGMKSRTSTDFEPMSNIAGAPQVNRGTSFAGFLIGSQEGTYLGAISEMTWDLFSCSYLQAGHTWRLPEDLEIRGDVQFVDQRSVGSEQLGSFNTQLYGARLTVSYADALLSFEFNNTTAGADIRSPFGGDPSFNGLMISNFDTAGEKAYGVGITYDFSRLGLPGFRAFAAYSYGSMPAGHWEEEINATLDYRISTGVLKNLWLRIRYACNVSSGQMQTDDFRVILNYTFNF